MDKIEIPVSDENTDSYMIRYKRNIMHNRKVVAFIAGVCAGILFFAYEHIYITDYGNILGVQRISVLREIDIQNNGVVQYIFCIRIKQLLLLVLCASSIMAPVFMYLVAGYFGFGFGIVILSLLYQYGIKGIFLGVMLFFPHGIFYLLIFLITFYKIDKNGKEYYQKDTCENCIKRSNRTIFKQMVFGIGDLLIIVMLLGMGILSEVYISTAIVRKLSLLF